MWVWRLLGSGTSLESFGGCPGGMGTERHSASCLTSGGGCLHLSSHQKMGMGKVSVWGET